MRNSKNEIENQLGTERMNSSVSYLSLFRRIFRI